MKRISNLAAIVALLFGAIQANGQSITFDFQDGTDQGFGTGFGNDASKTFPIVNIGGSLRMGVTLGGFQVAGRQSQGSDLFLAAMNAATLNPSGYQISYDWYVDTSLSPGNYGTFLQLGTFINSGSGAYVQDFPGSGKDVELNGTQLASGQVFSGTVAETLTQKYGALDPGFLGQSFMRFGLLMNGDGPATTVYFDNISVTPIPEPASLSLLGLAAPALWMIRRRRSTPR
jgi:hypothetical protein